MCMVSGVFIPLCRCTSCLSFPQDIGNGQFYITWFSPSLGHIPVAGHPCFPKLLPPKKNNVTPQRCFKQCLKDFKRIALPKKMGQHSPVINLVSVSQLVHISNV